MRVRPGWGGVSHQAAFRCLTGISTDAHQASHACSGDSERYFALATALVRFVGDIDQAERTDGSREGGPGQIFLTMSAGGRAAGQTKARRGPSLGGHATRYSISDVLQQIIVTVKHLTAYAFDVPRLGYRNSHAGAPQWRRPAT